MNFLDRIFVSRPLGMNFRNYLINKSNSPQSLFLAKDKSRSKQLFVENGIPTPLTYFEIRSFPDIRLVDFSTEEFVIKPNRGMGGNGIMVLRKEGSTFVDPSGETYSREKIFFHIRKILDGEFSEYREEDSALVEERLHPSETLRFRDAIGLSDIRVVCFNYVPVMAMLRYPTRKSRGRANLSAGAVGMSVDMATGAITHIHAKGKKTAFSLEDFDIPPSFVVPRWDEIKSIAGRASEVLEMKYAGVDIILDSRERILVLEINGRPGLEIQNINERSLAERGALFV